MRAHRPNKVSRLFGIALLVAGSLFAAAPAPAQVNVLTQHNDNSRTGDNLEEPYLTTAVVNVNQFGKLFSCPVDGYIYAQPLYVSQLSISGGTHNVVYVVTEHNSAYAFDADSGAQLWHTGPATFGPSVPSTVYGGGYHDLIPEIGITGTPVIDLTAKTMYFDVFTKDTQGNYHHYLHALNITTGLDKSGSPVEITGSVSGTSSDSVNGVVTFDPVQHLQRPALLLSNGTLYISFGSHGDFEPYHGWVFAYSEATLAQEAIYCTTPNGQEGGIWMGGQGPAADSSGNIYLMVGNSDEGSENNAADYGESFIKLGLSGNSLSVLDYFKPLTYDYLNAGDLDMGSAGPLLLPGMNFLVGGGKQGILYQVSTITGSMGELNLAGDVPYSWQATDPEISNSPVYWDFAPNGPTIYVWGSYGGVLKSYNFNSETGDFNSTRTSQGSITSPGLPGGDLSISANGSEVGTGIVWASHAYDQDANAGTVEGELDAFDATNLTTPLWTSRQDLSRDDTGNVAKFSPPTVANGKVYLASFSEELNVYGLLAPEFPSGLQMISAPSDYSNVSLSQAFGGANVKLAAWNPATSQYVVTPTAPANHLKIGQGYWVDLPQTTRLSETGALASVTANFRRALPAGWSQIGDPFETPVAVSALEFTKNFRDVSFATATSGAKPLIGSDLYLYDSSSNAYQAVTAGQSLEPGIGYWIQANSATTLIVPHP